MGSVKPTRICITGGTGFIGQHFLRRLEREAGIQVNLLTRRQSAKSLAQNTQYVQGDLLDYESLRDFVERESVVVHLAYLPAQSRIDNLAGLKNLSRVCSEKCISRFIHVSTAVVDGSSSDQIVTELTECRPVSEYETTKLELESFVIERLRDSCDVTVLRPTWVFGAGGKGLVKLVDDLISDSQLVRYLKGSLFHRRRLNLVCVENVVEALWYLSCVKPELQGERFIVSDDEFPENNYDDVKAYVANELKISLPGWPPLPVVSGALPAALRLLGRSSTNPHKIYSCEKLTKLGYKRAIGFQEGLRRFLDWYKLKLNTASE